MAESLLNAVREYDATVIHVRGDLRVTDRTAAFIESRHLAVARWRPQGVTRCTVQIKLPLLIDPCIWLDLTENPCRLLLLQPRQIAGFATSISRLHL